jgi:hypothetical protein
VFDGGPLIAMTVRAMVMSSLVGLFASSSNLLATGLTVGVPGVLGSLRLAQSISGAREWAKNYGDYYTNLYTFLDSVDTYKRDLAHLVDDSQDLIDHSKIDESTRSTWMPVFENIPSLDRLTPFEDSIRSRPFPFVQFIRKLSGFFDRMHTHPAILDMTINDPAEFVPSVVSFLETTFAVEVLYKWCEFKDAIRILNELVHVPREEKPGPSVFWRLASHVRYFPPADASYPKVSRDKLCKLVDSGDEKFSGVTVHRPYRFVLAEQKASLRGLPISPDKDKPTLPDFGMRPTLPAYRKLRCETEQRKIAAAAERGYSIVDGSGPRTRSFTWTPTACSISSS